MRSPTASSPGETSPASAGTALAMINGKVTTVGAAMVPATDLGLLRGDGVFEVFEVHRGAAFAVPEHLARLAKSAAALALPLDLETVRAEVYNFVGALGPADGDVRLIITRSGTRLLLHEPVEDVPAQIRLALVPHQPTPLLMGVKSLSYALNMHATRLARAQGADDALLYSPTDNQVLEGPTMSFAWVTGNRLCTPPLSAGILDSITRRIMLEVTDAEERSCTVEDLAEAEGACVMGTGIGVVPVSEIRDVVQFTGTAGPPNDAYSPGTAETPVAPTVREASELISEAANAVNERIRTETTG